MRPIAAPNDLCHVAVARRLLSFVGSMKPVLSIMIASGVIAGCATTANDPSDAEAESDPAVADGKADSASALFGNYDLDQIHNGSPQNADGDIISLSLFAEL